MRCHVERSLAREKERERAHEQAREGERDTQINRKRERDPQQKQTDRLHQAEQGLFPEDPQEEASQAGHRPEIQPLRSVN